MTIVRIITRVRLAHLGLLALVTTGCETDRDRWNEPFLGPDHDAAVVRSGEEAISLFRPGVTSLAVVEQCLGSLEPDTRGADPYSRATGITGWTWGEGMHRWNLSFTSDGVLRWIERSAFHSTQICRDAKEARASARWYASEWNWRSVSPERAQEFAVGSTTQRDVVDAWGCCVSARCELPDGFRMQWEAGGDRWDLEFAADGTLRAAPLHVALYATEVASPNGSLQTPP